MSLKPKYLNGIPGYTGYIPLTAEHAITIES